MEEFNIIYNGLLNDFGRFYERLIPFILFVLCYLLFKKQPNKKAYIHLGLVIFLVMSKHWASLMNLSIKADDLGIDFDIKIATLNHLAYAMITTLSCIFILALMHRNTIGYDTLLKKEIWGVWAKENNTSDYFDAQERKLRTQGAKDNEQ